jgi:CheY-like chemotaxis protein
MASPTAPRALVVDSDRLVRVSICRALETVGYRAYGVASIADALAMLSEAYDLALVDVHLGDGKGLEFVRVLDSAAPRTRVVVVGAHPAPAGNLPRNIVAWLRKPFELDELLSLARAAPHA